MTHNELLEKAQSESADRGGASIAALIAVVKLHKVLLVKDYENDTDWYECQECTRGISPSIAYPCPTIQAIEKELG